jgi:hypothetical protein
MNQDREITREELHQLVWSKPTITAAKEFGLSDALPPWHAKDCSTTNESFRRRAH